MISSYKSVLIPVGAALCCGVAGTILYTIYARKRSDDQDEEPSSIKKEILVPEAAVGHIYGRHGLSLQSIEKNTMTEINFKDTDVEGYRMIIINGLANNIKLAENFIQKVVDTLPVTLIEEIYVPHTACSHIIGRNEETIKGICRTTGAKVSFNMDQVDDYINEENSDIGIRRLVLRGTETQILAAKILIQEKVEEAKELQEKIESSAANLSLRSRASKSRPSSNEESFDFSDGLPHQEQLSVFNKEKSLDVYVSSIDSAAHFWVQVVGPCSVKLDTLNNDMTEFYNIEENSDNYQLDKIQNGDLVAARFPEDNNWYRGQISISKKNPPPEGMTTVFYLDFGDTRTIPISHLCELRTDFLKLNFQAIECVLADVEYESATSDEATDMFEELSYAAQWKPVQLTPSGYYQLGSKTLPVVKLIDTSGPNVVDIGMRLISLELAEKNVQSLPPSLE